MQHKQLLDNWLVPKFAVINHLFLSWEISPALRKHQTSHQHRDGLSPRGRHLHFYFQHFHKTEGAKNGKTIAEDRNNCVQTFD